MPAEKEIASHGVNGVNGVKTSPFPKSARIPADNKMKGWKSSAWARRMQRKGRNGTALFVLLRCRRPVAACWPRRSLPRRQPPVPRSPRYGIRSAVGVTCHDFTLLSACIARPEGIGNPAAELISPLLAFVRRNTEQAPRAFRTAVGY